MHLISLTITLLWLLHKSEKKNVYIYILNSVFNTGLYFAMLLSSLYIAL